MDVPRLEEFMVKRGGSLNPKKFQDETFELLSIPAYDKGEPEIVRGSDIGSSKKCVEPRDVLLSKIVPHIRRCWIVPKAGPHRQIASGEWIQFRSDQFHPEYVRHFFLSDSFHNRFMKTVSGVGGSLLRARPAQVANIMMLLPPLDDQICIAHLLSKVEGLIAQRKQNLQQLDDLLKSVFLEMFGDPVRNERGWDVKKLGDIALVERGRFSPRPRNDPKYYNGVYPFIQTGDISRANGRLREYTQTLNELGTKVSKEFNVGTIVIAIVGATIGETAILEISTYAPDSVIGITPKSQDLETEAIFVEYILRFWKPVLRARAPEAARANINIKILNPLSIIIPPGGEREKFSTISNKIEKLRASYQQSLTELENLYGILSQKAFKGELDLSRLPLPSVTEKISATLPKIEFAAHGIAHSGPYALPDPVDLKILESPEGRKALIEQWLNVSLEQLESTPFSAQNFMDTAQQRLWDLTEDETPEWGETEYDQVKDWIFQALKIGRLSQAYDDAGNRVQILSAKD